MTVTTMTFLPGINPFAAPMTDVETETPEHPWLVREPGIGVLDPIAGYDDDDDDEDDDYYAGYDDADDEDFDSDELEDEEEELDFDDDEDDEL